MTYTVAAECFGPVLTATSTNDLEPRWQTSQMRRINRAVRHMAERPEDTMAKLNEKLRLLEEEGIRLVGNRIGSTHVNS